MANEHLPEYSAEEVASHRLADSAWIIFRGNVLDVTRFLTEHPGGEISLLEVAGEDATEKFIGVGHSKDAEEMTKQFLIGRLKQSNTAKSASKKCSCKLLQLTQKQREFALYLCLPTAVALSLIIAYRFVRRWS